MRLFTVQSRAVYDELVETGIYRCDGSKSAFVIDCAGFREAYNWMVEQMTKRIGPAPTGVTYPVWAWPAFKKQDGRYLVKGQVLIEFEAPRKEILFSDFDGWHSVLCGYLFAENDAEYDAYEEMDADEKEIAKLESWEKIFEKRPLDKCQATLWELRLRNVTSVSFPTREF